ncbi:MAG: isoprenylcysteine carboxylmethyltransferase family protein [Pseudomonadota bacterium]
MFEGMRLTPDLPPVWLGGFALMAWVLGQFLPLVTFDVTPLGRVAIWAGLAIIIWSAVWFWRKKTPIEPGHAPKALIIEGPYRINRNPIYTGLVMILVGFALNQGAITALLPAVIYPVLITRRFILPEEALLRQAFGAEADAYIARSRRW